MRHALVGRRSYEDGHAHRRSLHSSTQIAVAAIDQHPWAKPDTLKGAAIGPQRHFIVAATLDKIPGAGFHTGLRKRFIFVKIYRFHLGFLKTNALLLTVTGLSQENL